MDNLLSSIFDEVRKEAGADIESQGISLLFHVMNHDPDPLLVKELQALVQISHGSVIRNLRVLGSADDHPRGGECKHLIKTFTDTKDRRRKLVMLSHKGRQLRERILSILAEYNRGLSAE
jgi:DNA-binding MarR family transcriptional regulator